MNIWQFQKQLSLRLLIWSVFSMVFGALFALRRDKFSRGLGGQFAAWGLIDALIALFGARTAQKRQAQLEDPLAPEVVTRESHNLRRLLLVNTALDVGYMTGGAALALTKGKTNPGWRGHGLGIIIQGAFLFVFDLFHAVKVK